MHEIVEVCVNSKIFYKLLLLVEAIQFLWYSIHPNFSFLWTNKYADYPRSIAKYVQVKKSLSDI